MKNDNSINLTNEVQVKDTSSISDINKTFHQQKNNKYNSIPIYETTKTANSINPEQEKTKTSIKIYDYDISSKFISIIIPVYKESNINHFLNNLYKQTYKNFEIIVVDGDDSKTTIEKINSENYQNIKMLVSEKGRSKQMNKGAEIAKGEILLFLHSDSELQENTLKLIKNFFISNEDYTCGAFSLRFSPENLYLKIIAFFTNLRSKINKIPYGDQGIFIKSKVFKNIGGYKNIPILEDVDLMERLKKHNHKIKILNEKIITSSRKWLQNGYIKNTLFNRIIMLLYFFKISPSKIEKFILN